MDSLRPATIEIEAEGGSTIWMHIALGNSKNVSVEMTWEQAADMAERLVGLAIECRGRPTSEHTHEIPDTIQ